MGRQAAPSAGSAPLFGRDRELARFAHFLAAARELGVPQPVAMSARSGFGKTSVLTKAVERARDDGWLVFATSAHPAQQHSAATALRRLMQTGLKALGDAAARYTSGLETDLAGDGNVAHFEQAVRRLFEAIVLDYPVLIAIDDAQWLDSASASCLQSLIASLATAQLVLAVALRSELPAPFPDGFFSEIPLQPLDRESAAQIVRAHHPSAGDELVSAILDRAAGIPFDITMLAQQARDSGAISLSDLTHSVKAVVADRVRTLPPAVRDFLQLCSVMQEPIDLRIIDHLFNAGNMIELLAQTPAGYVTTAGAELTFSHALVGQAVRSTVEVEFPYHKRILETLLALDEQTLKGYDRIAYHARANGRHELEQEYVIRLARAAYASGAFDVALDAFARAAGIGEIPAAVHVPFHSEYASALRVTERWEDARDLLDGAVRSSINRGIGGIGELAASLVWSTAIADDCERAQIRYEHLLDQLQGDDRSELLAIGALLAMELRRPDWADQIAAELGRTGSVSSIGTARVHVAQARFAAWDARFADARAHLDQATERNLTYTPGRFGIDMNRLQIDFLENGCAVSRDRIPALLRQAARDLPRAVLANVLEISGYSDLARGAWTEALSRLTEFDASAFKCDQVRIRVSCMSAAFKAFNGEATPFDQTIENDLEAAIRRNQGNNALQLGFWYAAALVNRDAAAAKRIGAKLKPWLNGTIYGNNYFFPLSAYLYAQRAQDEALLRELAGRRPAHKAPWLLANDLLAIGAARRALDLPDAEKELASAEIHFRDLEAPFLAAFAAHLSRRATKADLELLASLRVIDQLVSKRASKQGKRPDELTARELNVAELVAEGYANRRIAEELVLSERTVEAHLANVFSKLGVSSRTQVARWVIERKAAKAS